MGRDRIRFLNTGILPGLRRRTDLSAGPSPSSARRHLRDPFLTSLTNLTSSETPSADGLSTPTSTTSNDEATTATTPETAPVTVAAETPATAIPASGFARFGLGAQLLEGLAAIGYSEPSPIQQAAIPELMLGRDLVGQAQTGTGKTAAFALPMLAGLDPDQRSPQVLVLAPTRELALQVAAAFNSYAAKLPGVRTMAIYGGADFRDQIHQLKRGVQIVVGTPGRVMDHMRQGTLDLSGLKAFLDRTPACAAAVLAYNGREAVKLGERLWALPMGHLLS